MVSEFLPGIPWSVRNAIQRNKTICALSKAMILIESGTNGGSMEAGRSSLNMKVPLFAPVYGGMPDSAVGNRQLLKEGARPLLKSSSSGRANMRELLSIVLDSDILKPELPEKYPKVDGASPQLVQFLNRR
ncbi:MAG: DNA-processing protein DprA [Deltaproteobacteria bacterium]|nr:DNA-processing protein DprA [Deltaproteobacteria bacterium]